MTVHNSSQLVNQNITPVVICTFDKFDKYEFTSEWVIIYWFTIFTKIKNILSLFTIHQQSGKGNDFSRVYLFVCHSVCSQMGPCAAPVLLTLCTGNWLYITIHIESIQTCSIGTFLLRIFSSWGFKKFTKNLVKDKAGKMSSEVILNKYPSIQSLGMYWSHLKKKPWMWYICSTVTGGGPFSINLPPELAVSRNMAGI